ncbi:MAG TPA: DNA helicase RecG, partial [Acidimicrobiales bacterium]|nr:DNA helicase RecG [Acidimicrobiales bacterium]
MAVTLDRLAELEITELKGVGPERAKALEDAFEIETVLDLVTHYPRRYLDQTRMATITELRPGDQAWVFGRVLNTHVVPRRGKVKPRLEVRVTDGSGQLKVTFFNQPWRQKQFPDGTEALFFGKVDTFKGAKAMANPDVDLLGEPELGIRP